MHRSSTFPFVPGLYLERTVFSPVIVPVPGFTKDDTAHSWRYLQLGGRACALKETNWQCSRWEAGGGSCLTGDCCWTMLSFKCLRGAWINNGKHSHTQTFSHRDESRNKRVKGNKLLSLQGENRRRLKENNTFIQTDLRIERQKEKH